MDVLGKKRGERKEEVHTRYSSVYQENAATVTGNTVSNRQKSHQQSFVLKKKTMESAPEVVCMNHLLTRLCSLFSKKNRTPVSLPACFASKRKWVHFLLFPSFRVSHKICNQNASDCYFRLSIETESPQPPAPLLLKMRKFSD